MNDIYDTLKKRLQDRCQAQDLLHQEIRIRAKTLTPEEAIGNPEADDFPLQKGKERLMQAEFGLGKGQAFTDQYGDFTGRLSDVVEMNLDNNYRRAVFVASLNAVLNHLGEAKGTVHCRDQDPAQCAVEVTRHIREKFGPVRITQVGFQPRLLEDLHKEHDYRILDLDPDNIGARKWGVMVEGPEYTQEAVKWADLLLVTGTTLVNNTISDFLKSKPVIFYGTTIAGAAHLMQWDRVCPRSR